MAPRRVQRTVTVAALGVPDGDATRAAELAEHLRPEFCWTGALGWMNWDGRRWHEVPDPIVHEQTRQWVILRYQETMEDSLATKPNSKSLDEPRSWLKYHTDSKIEALTKLTRGILCVDVAEFDAHAHLLNVQNGVVDLRTGKLNPHDPALHLTKVSPTPYVPGATHPDFDQALRALSEDVRDWVQLRYGQAITGHTPPDDLLIFEQGGGENGKGALNGGIPRALGDYYLQVSHRALLADPSAIPTEVAAFRDARFALLDELPDERRLDITRMKSLIGTTRIPARKLYKDAMSFAPSHTLFISCNTLPVIHETDRGTWRRPVLLRFPYRWLKPGEKVVDPAIDRRGDPGLRPRLEAGGDGRAEAVLAWLVAGAMRWYAADKNMPELPKRIAEDTRAWRKRADLLLSYAGERLVFERGPCIQSTDLLDDFNRWLDEHNHPEWGDQTFTDRFGSHELWTTTKRRTKELDKLSLRSSYQVKPERATVWTGVRWRTDADDRTEEGAEQDGYTAEASAPATGATGQSNFSTRPVLGKVTLTPGTPGTPSLTRCSVAAENAAPGPEIRSDTLTDGSSRRVMRRRRGSRYWADATQS